jgi:hypothetical protein
VGAEPDVPVPAHVDIRVEVLGVELAHPAVGAVASDDQVGVGEVGEVLNLAFKLNLSAETYRTLNQNVEQTLATHTEAVSAKVGCPPAPDVHFHVIEAVRTVAYFPCTLRVAVVETVEQIVPEHHTPPIGYPSGIAFDNDNIMILIAQLH